MKLRAALLALAVALAFGACQGKVSVEKDKDGTVKVKVDNKKSDTPETRFKKAVDALELKATNTPALKSDITAKVAGFKADFEKVKADPAALNTLITRVESYSNGLAAAPAAPAAGGKLGTAAPAGTVAPVGGKLGGTAPAPAGTVPGGKLGGTATPPVGGKLGGAPAGTAAPAGSLPGGKLGGSAPPAGGSKLGAPAGTPAPAGSTAPAAGGMGGK